MVIAIEPAAFREAVGMRIEQVVLVTAAGGEVLAPFDLTLRSRSS
jgi:Xaa-Pro aminopeptidase